MTNGLPHHQSRIVLLVEDEPAYASLITAALAGACETGFRVRHVNHLEAARELLASEQIDVVLSDLTLPDSSARNTFQLLRSVAPGVPIVVLSSPEDEPSARELLDRGAQDYLLKDEVEPKLLTRSLRFAIEQQRSATLAALNLQLEQTKASLTSTVAELENAHAELAQFTYFASHDLQEPLRKINYFADELRMNLGEDLNEMARRDLHYICGAARRLQALVQSFLSLACAGSSVLNVQAVDLEACTSDVLDGLQERIEASGACIERDPLPTLHGEATLLSQLYENLISNALKFTHGAPPRICLTAEACGSQWLLGVSDNGIGIEPEFAQRVFAPFQRARNQGHSPGAGIGLAICRKVVSRLGGRIWVESTPGQGAHFKFLLPAICAGGEAMSGP